MTQSTNSQDDKAEVTLMVTCLVDLFRPSVGFASVKLLRAAGFKVRVPNTIPCCGQPALNAGDAEGAREIAKRVILACEQTPYTVLPSGSCASTLRCHYPELFKDDKDWLERSKKVAKTTYELTAFLVDVCQFSGISSNFKHKVTYHDSCSGLRELGIKQQPRKLLKKVKGLDIIEHDQAEVCCGFGGMFCIKYGDISNQIVSKKANNIATCGANVVLAGDMGCLMHISGKLQRNDIDMQVRHVAEALVNPIDSPPIGQGKVDGS